MKRKRLQFNGQKVVLLEEDLPPLRAGAFRVRGEWTQVSIGTEVATIKEAAKEGRPLGLGYSHVGVVEELGPGVEHVALGQRVLSSVPHASAAHVPADPGRVVPVPEGLAPDLATFGVLGSVAHHIVERGAPRLLEPTAVVGLGVVGSMILQLARACGARPLIALDTEAARLRKARELGADHVVDVSREDAGEAVRRLTDGQGVGLCLEAAASPRAYETAVATLGLRGRLIVSSAVFEAVPFRINEDIVRRELSIIGAHQPQCPVEENPYHLWTQPGNRLATMEAMRDGRLRVEHLVSHRVPPEEAPALYERLLRKDRSIVSALIDWRG